MSELHLGSKRVAILRVLIWAGILAAAVFFWTSVGIVLIAWLS